MNETCGFSFFFFNDIFIKSKKDFQKGSSQPFILSFLEPINNFAQDQNHFSVSTVVLIIINKVELF